MERVLNFLKLLHDNNNREWFNAHKSEYVEVRSIMETFALSLYEGIKEFDPSVGELGIKDMTYRIYRDTRFSKDKKPYKEHIGIFIARGGKCSGYAGYYFQISCSTPEGGWESVNMAASGDYIFEPKVVKVLREDIAMGGGDFREALSKADRRMKLEFDSALKKVPKGFDPDSPDADYLRLRTYCMSCSLDESFILSPTLRDDLLNIFKSTLPFIQYLNRAIEYVKEGNE